MQYADAREFFEAARDANADARRCKRVLDQLEEIATRVSGNSFEVHARGGSKHDRLERAVIQCAEVEERLRFRMLADWQLIDRASEVLYGKGYDLGLYELVPHWWVDCVWFYYLAGWPWKDVAWHMGKKSKQSCIRAARCALEAADAHGMIDAMEGRGFAEG